VCVRVCACVCAHVCVCVRDRRQESLSLSFTLSHACTHALSLCKQTNKHVQATNMCKQQRCASKQTCASILSLSHHFVEHLHTLSLSFSFILTHACTHALSLCNQTNNNVQARLAPLCMHISLNYQTSVPTSCFICSARCIRQGVSGVCAWV